MCDQTEVRSGKCGTGIMNNRPLPTLNPPIAKAHQHCAAEPPRPPTCMHAPRPQLRHCQRLPRRAGCGPRVPGCRTGHTAAPDPGVYATAPAATPATAPATSPAAAPAVALLQPLLLPKQLSKQPAIICHPTPHREPEVVPRRDVARAGEGASGDVGGAPSHGEEQRGSQGYVTVEGVIVQQGQAVVTGK